MNLPIHSIFDAPHPPSPAPEAGATDWHRRGAATK